MDATSLLSHVRLMPVVTISDADTAVPLAQALLAGGLDAIEVTLRSTSALDAMQRIATEVPQILLGAGSVRTPDQFAQVRSAGCAFAVSPGATEKLLAAANMPYLPGAATASECLHLLERGYALQKFFPAEASGGTTALKSIAQPIPEVRFCPTGGINAQLAPSYFALDCVACVGGSWFVPGNLLDTQDFSAIEACVAQAVALTRS